MGTGAPPSGVIHRNRQEHRRPCAYRAHTTGAATATVAAPASCPNAPRTGVGLILRCVCGCPAPTNGLSASVRLPTPPHRPFDQLHFSGHCTFRYCTFGSCTFGSCTFGSGAAHPGDDSTDLPSRLDQRRPQRSPRRGGRRGGRRCPLPPPPAAEHRAGTTGSRTHRQRTTATVTWPPRDIRRRPDPAPRPHSALGRFTHDPGELRVQPLLVLADQRPELRVDCPGPERRPRVHPADHRGLTTLRLHVHSRCVSAGVDSF
jgi:hypothetical protein